MLFQMAQVYETVRIDNVVQFVPWGNRSYVEKHAVKTIKDTGLNMLIDHSGPGYFAFGSDIVMSNVMAGLASADPSSAFGDYYHSYMASEDRIGNHLVCAVANLATTANCIDGLTNEAEMKLLAMEKRQISNYLRYKDDLLKKYEERKEEIKERKSEVQEMAMKKAKEIKEEARKEQEKRRGQEESRLKKEKQARDAAMESQQARDREKELVTARLNQLIMNEKDKQIVDSIVGDEVIEKMDQINKLEQKKRDHLDKERKNFILKTMALEKRNDHMARAKHLEECKLRREANSKYSDDRRLHWLAEEKLRIEAEKMNQQLQIRRKNRLERMKADKDEFAGKQFGFI